MMAILIHQEFFVAFLSWEISYKFQMRIAKANAASIKAILGTVFVKIFLRGCQFLKSS